MACEAARAVAFPDDAAHGNRQSEATRTHGQPLARRPRASGHQPGPGPAGIRNFAAALFHLHQRDEPLGDRAHAQHSGTHRHLPAGRADEHGKNAPSAAATDDMRDLIRIALDTLPQEFDDGIETRPDDDARRTSNTKKRAAILAKCLPKIGASLNAIAKEFAKANEPLYQSDNFERRIALSRLYISRFRQLAGRLRIGRLEGFVPYDEFVERKLGAAYALIDLISARFERIKADVTVLRQIETAQHNRVVQEITLELQLSADVALFIFLL